MENQKKKITIKGGEKNKIGELESKILDSNAGLRPEDITVKYINKLLN